MNKTIYTFILLLCIIFNVKGQFDFGYSISLIPKNIPNLLGLHSYVYAQNDGKWLIIGGRKDGLHARQPFRSFPESMNNTNIYVIDVKTNQWWSKSVNSLPTALKEQLQSTNMNFHQVEDTLFIIGGYGFSTSSNDHITYPYLTSISVGKLMKAIEQDEAINDCFKQIEDVIFAVTGGHLQHLDSVYYLIGGHRFDGRYNPMGHASYTQEYTNQIRKFKLNNSGPSLSYSHYSAITDAVHLRRRDYNLLPQIFPNGEQGFTISSGVFQINADLPFLYPVDITKSGYTPITEFNQYLSNYHSAFACLYEKDSNQMYSIFFGGMSQYYYEDDQLIKDDRVPFVKTISCLMRDARGFLKEYQLPIEMPKLQGASAEFIPNLDLPLYSNKIIKLDDIKEDRFMIGHIYGGINSLERNPFSSNQTEQTNANSILYEVWLNKDTSAASIHQINGKNPFQLSIYPNPIKNQFSLAFKVQKNVKMSYLISNQLGQIISRSETKNYSKGINKIEIDIPGKNTNDILFLTVIFDDKYYVSEKLIFH